MGYLLKQIFEVVLCFIMPPAAVFVASGYHISCCSHTTLNILLTLLGWVPGTIHAIWFAFCWPGRRESEEPLLPE
jgi:uncharacterized membrane protein YqaE (UPF0057 family)